MNRVVEQLENAILGAFESLEFWGRCVIITYETWDLGAVRRFILDHEEPRVQALQDIDQARLEELFPRRAYPKQMPFSVCRTSQPKKMYFEGCLQTQLRRQ